jgi:dipeptidase E
MNLLLYSGGDAHLNGSLDSELLSLVGRKGRITFIPSCTEGHSEYFECFKREKRRLGIKRFSVFSVDKPFSKRALNEALASEAIFLSGGNTFYFLYHLRKAGLLAKLRVFAKKEGVLFGLSAGSIIMTPRIDLAGLVPGESDLNEIGIRDFSSLALAPFEVYPHYSRSLLSVHLLTRYSKKAKRPVYAFPDGSGMVVRGSTLALHGDLTCFVAGRSFRTCSF